MQELVRDNLGSLIQRCWAGNVLEFDVVSFLFLSCSMLLSTPIASAIKIPVLDADGEA